MEWSLSWYLRVPYVSQVLILVQNKAHDESHRSGGRVAKYSKHQERTAAYKE
jgi:hypothetical protein